MTTIIQFPNGEKAPDDTPEDGKSGIAKCLELASQRDLAEVFIIGRKANGDVWFSTNNGDLGTCYSCSKQPSTSS